MYSPKVIEQTLDAFAAKNGWRPEPHSIAQVEEFIAYINSIVDVNSNSVNKYYGLKEGIRLTQRRRDEITRWIENEQFMCFSSADYFMTRYAWITGVGEEVFRYAPRDSQKIFHSIIAEFDEEQVAIELFILKARQLGVSTAVAVYFLHRILFRVHTRAVMASVQQKQSDLIGRIQETCTDRLPFWLPPGKKTYKAGTREWTNGSILSIQSGSQAFGIAQGWTPSCLPPSTLIRMSNGFFKPICEVTPEDKVLTHCGYMRSVKKAFRTIRHGDHSRILKLWGSHQSLECTLNHLIRTPEGWLEAAEIGPGDYVTHPVRQMRKVYTTNRALHTRTGKGTPLEIVFDLDYDLGYLAGFYLAEGHIKKTNPSEITFACHDRELSDRLTSVRKAIDPNWKVSGRKAKSKNGSRISIHCSWMARWLRENFGRTENKHMPDWAWHAGHEFCTGILRGYLDGDGHCEKRSNNVIAPSICRAIIYQMRDLVASLGLGWCSIYHKPAYTSGSSKHRETWKLVLSGRTGAAYRAMCGYERKPTMSKSRHWKYSNDGLSVDVMVEEVRNGWSEEFWDIEVDDDDHSFTTEQCAVHNCIHISEVGDIPNPKKTLEEGLFRAAHSHRDLFFVMEGTGNGDTGWQAEKWRDYKENWGKGGRFRPIFIPPACAKDLYPLPDWIRKNPVPENFRPTERTLQMQRKGELFVRSTDYLSKTMGTNFKMGREYLWFWDCNWREAVASHTEKIWLGQMACSDDEALQSKHDLVMNHESIEVITREREKSYVPYAITGKTILMGSANSPYEPNPAEVDYDRERIPVRWNANDGNTYDWELVPLQDFDDSSDGPCLDKLLIFQEPKEGVDYSIGVDCADGLGMPNEDRSTISVLINRSGRERDEQVAAFTSLQVNSPQMARIAACVAALYGAETKNPLGCKMAIEQRRKPGDECQHQLKIMGFYNHHRMVMYDSTGLPDPSKAHKEGFYTNRWSRTMMLNKFFDALNTGYFKPNCPILIRQLKAIIRIETGGQSKIDHASGQHDDNVFASGVAYFAAHDMDNNAMRQESRYSSAEERNPVIDLRWSENSLVLL